MLNWLKCIKIYWIASDKISAMTSQKNPPVQAQPSKNHVFMSLLLGNFVIGTGVMLVMGNLNELAASLQVSVAAAGQLITAAAITVCIAAPLMAALVARIDRRFLLAACMIWYALMHAASALAPDYASLMVLRILAVIAAAIFTPQAAAVAGMLASPEGRGKAITTVFLGWSLASVLGAPLSAWVGGAYGWRVAFWIVAALSLLCAALLWRVLPRGLKPPALSAAMWRQTLGSKLLIVTVLVTVLSASGQFVQWAYFSPYVTQQLKGSSSAVALMLASFGLFGVIGSFAVSRVIDRVGAARAVMATLLLMATSLLLWPFGASVSLLMLVSIPWALGCFACNSAQQARLVAIAPAVASVSIALNTSALYLGQGIGSAGGGLLIAQGQMARVHWLGFVGMALAIGMSLYAERLASAPIQR